jgi:hypothetical protein
MMKRFHALSVKEKLTVLSIWIQLALVDIRLTVFPHKFNKNWLYGKLKSPSKNPKMGKKQIQMLTHMTLIASSHSLFFNMTCLRKALVIRSRLRGSGLDAILKFGTRKTGDKEHNSYQAHAWVELDGEVITPSINTITFQDFTTKR